MSDLPKAPIIEIRSRAGGKITSGRSTQVFVDGQELRNVAKLVFTIEAQKIARVELTLVGDIRVDPLVAECCKAQSSFGVSDLTIQASAGPHESDPTLDQLS